MEHLMSLGTINSFLISNHITLSILSRVSLSKLEFGSRLDRTFIGHLIKFGQNLWFFEMCHFFHGLKRMNQSNQPNSKKQSDQEKFIKDLHVPGVFVIIFLTTKTNTLAWN